MVTNDTHLEEDKPSMAKHIADLKQREAPILNATVQSDGDQIPLRGNRQEFNIPRFWVIVSWEGSLKCGRSVQIWNSTPTHVAFSVPCGATRGCQGDKSCTHYVTNLVLAEPTVQYVNFLPLSINTRFCVFSRSILDHLHGQVLLQFCHIHPAVRSAAPNTSVHARRPKIGCTTFWAVAPV